MVESNVHGSPGGKRCQPSPAKTPLISSVPDTSKLSGEEQGKMKRPKIVLSHQLGHPGLVAGWILTTLGLLLSWNNTGGDHTTAILRTFLRCEPCTQPSCEKMQQTNQLEVGSIREQMSPCCYFSGSAKQRETKAGPQENWKHGHALLLRFPAEATRESHISVQCKAGEGGSHRSLQAPLANGLPAFMDTSNTSQNRPEQHCRKSPQLSQSQPPSPTLLRPNFVRAGIVPTGHGQSFGRGGPAGTWPRQPQISQQHGWGGRDTAYSAPTAQQTFRGPSHRCKHAVPCDHNAFLHVGEVTRACN